MVNLGIKHYLRSVKYKEGAHIYVVIPTNQEQSNIDVNSLFGTDYYIIDGASNRSNKEESPFLLNGDVFMNPALPIFKTIVVGLALMAILYACYKD